MRLFGLNLLHFNDLIWEGQALVSTSMQSALTFEVVGSDCFKIFLLSWQQCADFTDPHYFTVQGDCNTVG